jgi:hypothetical protein
MRQNGCRLIHAARGRLSVGCDFIMATGSRHGKATALPDFEISADIKLGHGLNDRLGLDISGL